MSVSEKRQRLQEANKMKCPYCEANIEKIGDRYSVPKIIKHETAYGHAKRFEVTTVYSCRNPKCKAHLREDNGVTS